MLLTMKASLFGKQKNFINTQLFIIKMFNNTKFGFNFKLRAKKGQKRPGSPIYNFRSTMLCLWQWRQPWGLWGESIRNQQRICYLWATWGGKLLLHTKTGRHSVYWVPTGSVWKFFDLCTNLWQFHITWFNFSILKWFFIYRAGGSINQIISLCWQLINILC